MGIVRGGLFVIASVLLFLLFLVGNVFLTLSLSLDYASVQPELVSVVESIAGDEINLEQEVEGRLGSMELYCQNNSEYVFNDESGQVFVIPCEVVSQGPDAVVDYSVNNFVEEIYYKDYDCDFLDCFAETEQPFFLISQKAKDYWNNKFYLSLFISLFLIALMFFLIEDKKNLPIVAGVLLLISALPFMKLNWVLSFFSDKSFLQFFTIFFAKAYTVFLISFSLGIILLGIGGVLKLFGIGFKISDFLDKLRKKKGVSKDKPVKQEISKSKKAK